MHENKFVSFCIGILLASMVHCIECMVENQGIFAKNDHATEVLPGKHLCIIRQGDDFLFYKEIVRGLDKDCSIVTRVNFSQCDALLGLMYFKILPPDVKRYIIFLMLGNTLDSNFEHIKTFKGHTDLVKAVAFSPNGEKMAMASYDKTVTVWDIGSGQQLFTFDQHSKSVLLLAYNGITLATT